MRGWGFCQARSGIVRTTIIDLSRMRARAVQMFWIVACALDVGRASVGNGRWKSHVRAAKRSFPHNCVSGSLGESRALTVVVFKYSEDSDASDCTRHRANRGRRTLPSTFPSRLRPTALGRSEQERRVPIDVATLSFAKEKLLPGGIRVWWRKEKYYKYNVNENNG